MSNIIKNIVFDFGGVLIDWNPRNVFRTIFETEQEVDWFLENICTMHWNEQQDAGRTIKEGTEILVKQHPEWQSQIEAYYGRWTEMLSGAIQETVDILSEFIQDDNYNVYGLTNWSAETFPIAQQQYDFLSWFDGIVVSGQEMCKKPDPKIYNILLDRYQLIPEESVFIDDNIKNVEAARKLKINAIHFTSPEELKIKLQEMSINVK